MNMDWARCVSRIRLPNGTYENVPTLGCFLGILSALILWLLTFAGVVSLFFIITSGIQLITSGGDPKKLEGAKKTFTYAIAGLLLIFLSFFIVSFISYVTRVNCINPSNPFSFTSCS